MTPKELKANIGKDIWVIPFGNSVRRRTPLKEQITKVTLEKVGNTLYYISGDRACYPIDGGYNKDNYGYIPFLTLEDATNYFVKIDLIKELQQFNYSEIDLDTLLLVTGLLEGKK